MDELFRAELQEVLQSRTFSRCERMRPLLSHLVEHAIGRRGEPLKEYVIGTEVFGRPESFDPREDPIVRVEVRRLRAKLEEYYRSGEHLGRFEIRLRAGNYLPELRERETKAASAAPSGDPGPRVRVTVRPFACLDPSDELSRFSRGLTTELVHQLSRLPAACAFAWGPWLDVLTGGRETKKLEVDPEVTLVVGGSIRTDSRQFSVFAQLVRPRDGSLLWSDIRRWPASRGAASQQRIATAIADSVRAVLETSASRELQ